ncbi:PTS trehalose transporter subunit IIBC [Propionigenium maris DSM 9537]|uniref:PTS trehalose transporter subunit IIBC n=1 Tax=Propionigenium maris DSM 9537 TaxID=1123000 RepID=A0A9W6LM98_9FUSO|nr:PTS trehalose transporter subunit IIBC [Propionigenium maris]GLI55233.1 PTS trehalose transporter subunit IIBC [Propionigenium maris DSM 9537]
MAKISKDDVKSLIVLVGGRDNVAGVTHCITRMRFALKDESKADIEKIKELKSVKGCFTNAGQFQVIIGPQVKDFYKAFIGETDINAMDKAAVKKAAQKNMNILERTISHLAEIFVPLLPAIITGGLILGFRNLIGDIKMFEGQTLTQISVFWAGVHSFLWLIGEAIFHFLPVGITWSVTRKMGGTPILGIILGITLVSPQLMNAYLIGSQTPEVWNFGKFTIEKVGYQAQVIPAMLAGVALAWIETKMRKITPASIEIVVVPFIAILGSVLLAHTVIGPFGRTIGDGVAFLAKAALTGPFAIVGSALFGFLYGPLVITGVHHTTNAVDLQLVQNLGGTMLWPLIALSNIAQGSAVLGIVMANKNKMEREVSIPAVISAYLGVTEPAMYGINLKYKFPMLCAMVGSALAAVIAGIFGVMSNGIGVGGIPGILSIKPQYWGVYALCIVVAIVVPTALTTVIYRKKRATNTL